jgi:hypothetical protein
LKTREVIATNQLLLMTFKKIFGELIRRSRWENCRRRKTRGHSLKEERDAQAQDGLGVTKQNAGHDQYQVLFIYTVFWSQKSEGST